MPSDPAKPEGRPVEALRALSQALEDAAVPWMLIGGYAVIARGVRRMTTDIDVVVRGGEAKVGSLLRVLRRQRIFPRIDDAQAFAEENLVLLLRHRPTGVDIDLSFGWTLFESEAIAASTRAKLGTLAVPTARAEDLVIYKAMAARPKDLEDAASLVLMHPEIDLARVRKRVAELAELAGEPGLLEELERLLARARSIRRTAQRRASQRSGPTAAKRKPRKA